jgi:hypothetical protein
VAWLRCPAKVEPSPDDQLERQDEGPSIQPKKSHPASKIVGQFKNKSLSVYLVCGIDIGSLTEKQLH